MDHYSELTNAILSLQDKFFSEMRELHFKINDVTSSLDQMSRKLNSLEARSSLRVCVLCSLESNLDGHSTPRCTVFPDIPSKTLRLAALQKCTGCLKDSHGQCDAKCAKCGANHNVLLCGKGENQSAAPSFKRGRY